ncbi:hypothetical protein TVAG_343240 [Trichomonas vaginalis G3]|uniref:Uncharacterized protein n=1 Tax=Trichomonas vaginalis (strain ATCC PRA-98 / G3) TaxID=412133 RepID=A2E1C8_TRIV3|nr:thymidylate synthase family [Trichomonas vaginalis G3]EAY13495.1 hypothetical protein TVAG_343240 [Trichomonas vaginalis G3]KAI5529241.1 thymidylate synthase family [Trichomonas vaginalis G3]|eukprot:XP_001325718.1 hypothetical protein [Trichomonas vaginalis G3]
MSSVPEFPFYFKQQITISNKEGRTGIITYWSKRNSIEELLNKLELSEEDRASLLCIGNLYTFDGLKYIILNSFLSNNISSYVFYGNDMNKIKEQARNMFTKDSEQYNEIKKQLIQNCDADVDFIMNTFVDRFKDHIYFVDFGQEQALAETIHQCRDIPARQITLTFYKYEFNQQNNQFPSEKSAFIVRDNDLQRLWKKVIHKIIEFGEFKKRNSIGESYYELIDFTYVLEAENRKYETIETTGEVPITDEFLKHYITEIISDKVPPGLSYTYGNRIARHLDATVKKLQTDPVTRQAHISLWLDQDVSSPNPPCLTDIDFNLQKNRLFMTCHFRSHDAFAALRSNMYGLVKLQEKVISQLPGVREGPLVLMANSSHIYERDIDTIKRSIVFGPECNADKRGYFTVAVEEKNIVICHYDYENKLLHKWCFDSSSVDINVMDQVGFYVTDVHHAMYLMKEVTIAVLCAQKGQTYVQDETWP